MFTYRLATPADAPLVEQWAINNPDIPRADIFATHRNKTGALVVEEDGVPVLVVPFYMLMQLAYLGFNPEASPKSRIKAMQMMLRALAEYCTKIGINEIQTMSMEGYPVAKWAVKHGFEKEDREAFVYRVPK
jgi:hypothetical protein